jgi:hypothetical protein
VIEQIAADYVADEQLKLGGGCVDDRSRVCGVHQATPQSQHWVNALSPIVRGLSPS